MAGELAFFRNVVPGTFLEQLLRAVVEGCGVAHAQRQRYLDDVDSVPKLRRLEVEKRFSMLLINTSSIQRTIRRTPSSVYTEFVIGGAVVLTALTRSHEPRWVKPEPYRSTRAQTNQMGFAFAGTTQPDEAERKLYALLVYGGPTLNATPTLARIVFPLPDGGLLPDKLDLLTELPHVVVSSQAAPATAPIPIVVPRHQESQVPPAPDVAPEVKLKSKPKPEEEGS
jgi:hypothetical protein